MMGVDLAIVLAVVLGLYMAWAIGANDVANAMGTSVGSGALTLGGAVIVAGIFEFSGAFLAGGHVTQTIRKGILDPDVLASVPGAPEMVVWGMLAALIGAATWLLIATRAGWPVSTTHSIVGAIAGFGAIAFGLDGVEWGTLGSIALSWVVSPLLSGVLAFLVFALIRRVVLEQDDPVAQARRWGPVFVFAVVAVIGLVTLYKGLKNLKLDLGLAEAFLLTSGIGLVLAALAGKLMRRVRVSPEDDRDFHYARVERMFGVLQVATACAVAFAHGSNDVANAIGPVAAILSVRETGGLTAQSAVPLSMLLVGGLGIVVGLATMGYRVIATVGKKITELTPTRGYAAEFAAAATIVVASRLGLPISTTHVLVGAVFGVGLARGIGALDYRVVGTVVVSWVVTIPAGALLTIFFYFFFKGLLT
jgi:PiT family inorganic phosphate transporter